jgi:hypothetical protein
MKKKTSLIESGQEKGSTRQPLLMKFHVLALFPCSKHHQYEKKKLKQNVNFVWLATRKKVPTVDNLLKNWPCEPTCPLCFCMQETTDHLLTDCNFSQAIWDRVAADCQTHLAVTPFQKGDIRGRLSPKVNNKPMLGSVLSGDEPDQGCPDFLS